jgi:hypothetical protein
LGWAIANFVWDFPPKLPSHYSDNKGNKQGRSQMKDITESKRARRQVRAKAKQCYHNAFRVVFEIPEYAHADYVEGLAVIKKGLVIEHGWIEKNGMIVDPTLPEDELDYFPGLRFKGRRGLAEAMQIPKPRRTRDDLPIFYRFGWGGIESPEFRLALAAAYRHVGMVDLARQYEEYQGAEESLSA